MRTRLFAPLATQTSELGLGTWGLSGDGYGPVADAEADAVIDRAAQLGITVFETADCYANGGMEARLGKLFSTSKQLVVTTRIGTDRSQNPVRKNFDPTYLAQAFERSQERLGRDPVDVVLLHNPSAVTVEQGEAVGVLKELAAKGRIRAWGVSAGNKQVATAALQAGAQVLELAYNLLHSHDLHAVAGQLALSGTAVMARSVLAHGLLTAHWSGERTFEEGDHRRERWLSSELRRRVDQLQVVRDMVGGDVLTPRAAALRFVLSNSLISTAVLGPRTTSQLDQLVREAGSGPPYLKDTVLADLPSRLSAVGITT